MIVQRAKGSGLHLDFKLLWEISQLQSGLDMWEPKQTKELHRAMTVLNENYADVHFNS